MKPKVNDTIWSPFHSGIKTEKKYRNKSCRNRIKDGKHVVSFKKALGVILSLPFLVLVLPFMLLSELDSTLDNMCRVKEGRIT